MSENKSGRKSYIDIGKGIGIYTIVLVHFTVHGSVLSQILLSFCVPFFFVVSGMLFSAKREPKEFLKNIINKIVLPLIAYGVIDAVFTVIWKFLVEKENFEIITLIKIIAKIFFVSGAANSNGPLWYLPVLIWLQLLMYLPLRCKNRIPAVIVMAVMFAAGFFVSFKGPFRIGQAPAAAVFFCAGILLKTHISKLSESKAKYAVFPLSAAVFGVSCYFNGFSEMAALNYGRNYLLYFVTGLSATIAILSFSMIIKQCGPLEFFGKNSLTIMCTHYHLTRYIIPKLLSLIDKENILEIVWIEVAFSVAIMLLMVLIVKLVNSKLPVLTGSYKLKLLEKFL